MQHSYVVDLTSEEMLGTSGGAEMYGCAMLGAFTAAAFLFGQWWAVGGSLLAAYNTGCFN